MGAFSLTHRLLSFTSPLGADKLLPERLSGSEGISELFHYKLDLLAEPSTSIDPTKIVGKRICVGITADESGTERYVNGIVSSFEVMNSDDEFDCYRIFIVPSLWMLTLTKNTRVFQNKTVIDVIKDVLSPYSISPTDDTSNTYAPLEYCTQYRETDFQFISRLMEQHGIFYYFEHTADDHTLVLQDTSSKLSDCDIQDTFKFSPNPTRAEGFYDFVIRDLVSRSTLVTGKYSAWDFSWKRYQTVLGTAMNTAGPLGANSNEDYDYAGATSYKVDATDTNLKAAEDAFTTVRRDVGDAATSIVEGHSNAICMQTGYSFTLAEHPQDPLNVKYLLTHIEHSVEQLPSYRSRKAMSAQPYVNTFVAMPFSIVYRSPQITPKPVVYGMHTGQVIVPSGEESHMDKYGRVNVQFWWDRLRKASTPDNTWLRVAQSWAGKGWGTYYWPRFGDEVLIGFMEGDPDQPIVVGSVYNGVNMPKYDPTGQYTLSGILTRSSKGGAAANANELRFEDKTGSEQIYMNAEKDYDLHVEHDWHTTVGNEEHITIAKNRFDSVGGDSHLKISGKHLEEIDGDAHLNVQGKNVVSITGDREHTVSGNLKESISQGSNISVGMNLNESVGQNYSLTVGMKQAIQAGMNFDVTAPMQISLNCGPNSIVLSPEGIGLNGAAGFISIGPAGITISGVMVMINSGGAPVMGSPGSAQSPQSPSSPTAPTAPQWPGDDPNSQAGSAAGGSAGTAPKITEGSSSSSPASSPAAGAAAGAAGAAAGAAGAAGNAANQAEQQAQQAVNQVEQAANQAVNQVQQQANQVASQAQQAANQAKAAANQAEQQAKAAVNQAVDQARGAYNQAQQAAAQAQAAAAAAVGQAKAAAQQYANQAEQMAQQAKQQAANAVQQAQQQAAQIEQQAKAEAAQAQQAAQQASQQAEQAVQQAKQQATQAVNQAKQQVQQTAAQAQAAANQAKQQVSQAASQAQQQATQAANQAKQAAGQAQQQAAQAQQQVSQAAQGAQQAASQAAQGAQQAASQATNSIPKGF